MDTKCFKVVTTYSLDLYTRAEGEKKGGGDDGTSEDDQQGEREDANEALDMKQKMFTKMKRK